MDTFKFLVLLDSICAFCTSVGLDWFQLTFLLAQNLMIGFVQRGMLIFVLLVFLKNAILSRTRFAPTCMKNKTNIATKGGHRL